MRVFSEINEGNRHEVNHFIEKHWFSTELVLRGQVVDMTMVSGIIVYEEEEIIGLITYRINREECEILSIDSIQENRGIGSCLLEKLYQLAKEKGCNRIKLITTNDNLMAMRFYQKRGFDMKRIYHNAMEISRKIKPSIPLIGDFGIPLKHEIEFEKEVEQ